MSLLCCVENVFTNRTARLSFDYAYARVSCNLTSFSTCLLSRIYKEPITKMITTKRISNLADFASIKRTVTYTRTTVLRPRRRPRNSRNSDDLIQLARPSNRARFYQLEIESFSSRDSYVTVWGRRV